MPGLQGLAVSKSGILLKTGDGCWVRTVLEIFGYGKNLKI